MRVCIYCIYIHYKNQFADWEIKFLSCEEQKRHSSRYDSVYFSTCMMHEKTTLFIHIPVCRCGAERFHVRLCCAATLQQPLFQLWCPLVSELACRYNVPLANSSVLFCFSCKSKFWPRCQRATASLPSSGVDFLVFYKIMPDKLEPSVYM